MESAPSRKWGIRGEETLTLLLVLRVIGSLLLRSQTETWFAVADWSCVIVAGCLLLQVLAVYYFPVRKKDDDHTDLVFRPGVVNGIYCVLLVPLAVMAEALQGNLHSHSLAGDVGVDLSEVVFLLATSCGMLFMAPSQLKRTLAVLYLVLVFASTALLAVYRLYFGEDLYPWLVGLFMVMYLMYVLPQLCPWSFTFGELCVICHILGSVTFRGTKWLTLCLFHEVWPIITNEVYVYVFVYVTILFVVLASCLVFVWDWCDNIIPFVLVYVACGFIAIAVIMFLTGHQPLLWLFWYIFGEHKRVSLLAWWSAVLIITVASFLMYTQHINSNQSGKGSRVSTSARKVFHGVVLAVYIPGLVVEPYFLLLASVIALAVLGVLEVARVISVQFLGPAVENSFRVFVDDKDQGAVIFTHIYLLVGLSLPLWLTHTIIGHDVRNYCGVISLGIGDTVACLVGMPFGNIKWPGTKKTVEGTLASIIAQLLFVIFAFFIGWVEDLSWLNVVFAVVLSSLYEAYTSQIDNLVLPVFMLAALPSVKLQV